MLSGSLPSFVQASTDANYTLDNSSGSMVMDLNSGSLVVNGDLSTAAGWSDATVRLHNGSRIYFNSAQTLGDLELHQGSWAAVALGNTAASGNLLQLSGLSIDRYSKLDLGDNSMILHYAPSQEAADNSMIFGLLASGSASGGWNEGPWTGYGINSSAAAIDASQKTALGFADNNILQYSSFAGVSLTDDNEILIRYTVYGDTNLDGTINRIDSSAFSSGLDGVGTGWEYGDFNYDGTINSVDQSYMTADPLPTISSPQYTPSLQIQPLSFTASQYAPWSGVVATFTDVTGRSSYSASNYTATIETNGFFDNVQITQPTPGADYFCVNAQTSSVYGGPLTIQIAYADGGPYTGGPSSMNGMITGLQLPTGSVPSTDASYTVSGSAGAVTLNVTAGTIAFNSNAAGSGNYWQNVTINASGSAHLIFNSAQTLGALNLSDTATVTVSQGSGGTGGNVLQLNSLSVGSAATLDLGDNSIILYYTPSNESSELSMVHSLLTSGYAGGNWNGTGIDSSAAASDSARLTAVGYLDNNNWGYSQFQGVNLADFNQILIKYTIYGDADLDGRLTASDIDAFIYGRDGFGTGWENGDFNYDGVTNSVDLEIFENEEQSLASTGQYKPTIQLSPLTVQPFWNAPFIGDIATFTDTANPGLPASDYTAEVYWGTGDLYTAQVYASGGPGSFRINAYSPVLTGVNSSMTVVVQYAPGSGYQGEMAIVQEPISVFQLPPGVHASADAAYSMSGSSSGVLLDLTAGSLTFDTNVSQDSNYFQNFNFAISGSAHAYFNAPETLSGLQIQDNAVVSVSKGSGGTNGNLLNVQTLSIDPNATLDLSDNAMIDWYSFSNESAASAQMSGWLQSGYNGGAWDGPGIDSSVAADDLTHATALGWLDNGFNYAAVGTAPIDPSVSSFEGVSLPTKDELLVRFTYKGDANLNGQVDSTDDGLLDMGLNHQGSGWVYGDFNYDGAVTSADTNAWTANYSLSITSDNYTPAFQPTGIVINPIEGVSFSGDIATFTDLLNPSNTDPSIYQAEVDWGDGGLQTAQVTATSTPGSFRINAESPALTNPNAVMAVTIQYADMNAPSPAYQGRPAAVSEPILFAPNPPVELTAAGVTDMEVDLTWTSVDGDTPASSYTVYRNGQVIGTTSALAYQDTGLIAGTQYTYLVRANSSTGASSSSQQIQVTTTSLLTGTTPPPTPTNISTSTSSWSSGTSITLKWSGGQNLEYEIERNGVDIALANTTTYTDMGVMPNSLYTYSVIAYDPASGNLSQPSSTTAATGADDLTINMPSITATTAANGPVTLSWDQPADPAGIFYYIITRTLQYGSGSPTTFPNVYTTTYTDSTAVVGNTYVYSVTEVNGIGGHSQPASVTVTAGISPVDQATAQDIPQSYMDYFYNSLTKTFRELDSYAGYPVAPPNAEGWFDPSTDINVTALPGYNYGEFQSVAGQVSYYDHNGNHSYDPGESVWDTGNSQEGLFEPGDPVLSGPTPPVGTVGNAYGAPFYYVDENKNGSPEQSEMITKDVNQLQGIEGQLAYRDIGGAGYWNSNDPIWYDANGNSEYDAGEKIIYQPVYGYVPLQQGDWGKKNGLAFYDMAGTGHWAPNDPVWADQSGYFEPVASNPQTQFRADFANFYPAVENLIPSFIDPSNETELNPPSLTLQGVFQTLGMTDWTKVPATTGPDGISFSYVAGKPDANSAIFPVQFQELSFVLSKLTTIPGPRFTQSDSDEFNGTAQAILNAYTALFGTTSSTVTNLVQQIKVGDTSPGALENGKWNQLEGMVTYIAESIYARPGGSWLPGTDANQESFYTYDKPSFPGAFPGGNAQISAENQAINDYLQAILNNGLWVKVGSIASTSEDARLNNIKHYSYAFQVGGPAPDPEVDWPNYPQLPWDYVPQNDMLHGDSIAGLQFVGFNSQLQESGAAEYGGYTVNATMPAALNPYGGILPTTLAVGPGGLPGQGDGWTWGGQYTVFSIDEATVEGLVAAKYPSQSNSYGQSQDDANQDAPYPNEPDVFGPLDVPGQPDVIQWYRAEWSTDTTAAAGTRLNTWYIFIEMQVNVPIPNTAYGSVPVGSYSVTPLVVQPPTIDRSSPPTDAIPLQSQMSLLNVVPDTNLDDIVQVDHDQTSFGNDTGSISYEMQREMPQVYIPLNTDGTDAGSPLPVHDYISQGGFGTSLDSVGMLLDQDGWTYADANENGQPYAVSVDTSVDNSLVIVDTANHVKRVEVIRPRGDAVLFNFEWNSSTQQFSPYGHPLGIDQDRLYILRDLTPADNSDLSYSLEFPSGIVQTFSGSFGFYASDYAPISSVTDTNTGISAGVLRSDPLGTINTPRYMIAPQWSGGEIASINYTTNITPSATIETTLGYNGNNQITSLEKSENGSAIPEFSYVSEEGAIEQDGGAITITRTGSSDGNSGDITLTTTIQGADGSSAEEVALSAGLITSDTVSLDTSTGSSSATTKYTYATGSGFYNNGAPQWGKVTDVLNPDGSWVHNVYDPTTGWLTDQYTPFKTSPQGDLADSRHVVFDYNATDSGGGDGVDTNSLVPLPRKTTASIGGTVVNVSFLNYQQQGSGSSQQITRQGSSATATWANAALSSTITLTGYDSYTLIGPLGTTTHTGTAVSNSTTQKSIGGAQLSSESTTTNAFGGLTGSNTSSSSGIGQGPVKITVPTGGGTPDPFGRTSIATVNASNGNIKTPLTTSYSNYGWLGPQSVTDPTGENTIYTYTPTGQVATATIYPGGTYGVTTSYFYDAAGNVIETRQEGSDGEYATTYASFDALGRLVSSTDALGQKTTYNYQLNQQGVLVTTTLPDGTSTEVQQYALDGTLLSTSGSAVAAPSGGDEGIVTSTIYNAPGNVNIPAGSTWNETYTNGGQDWTKVYTNLLGQQFYTQQSGPNGTVVTTYTTYDGNGRPVTFQDVDGSITHTEYNPYDGSVLDAWVDTNGNGVYDPGVDSKTTNTVTQSTADDTQLVGTKQSDVSASGNQQTTSYTSNSGLNTKSTSDSLTTSTSTSFTGSDGTVTVTTTNPDGTQTLDSYTEGLLTKEQTLGTDGTTVLTTVSYGYDGLRRNNSVTDWTGTTTFQLRADGSVQSMTLPDGRAETINAQDANTELPTNITRLDNQTQSQTISSAGQMTSQSGAGITPATYGYDPVTGELSSLTIYPSGSSSDTTGQETTGFSYDHTTGLLSGKTYADGSADSFTYNYKLQLASEALRGDFASFTYNKAGLQTGATYTGDNTGMTIYDSLGTPDDLGRSHMMTELTTTADGQSTSTSDVLSYNPQGQVAGETQASGANVHYDYNADSSIKDMKVYQNGQVISETDYAYDPISKRLETITVANGTNAPVTYTYTYKTNTNLIETVSTTSNTIKYTYEENTGRLQEIDATQSLQSQFDAQYTYTANDQRLTENVLQENADTQAIDQRNWTFGYDTQDQLTSVSDNGTTLYSYNYDGVGNPNGGDGFNAMNQSPYFQYDIHGDITDDQQFTYTWDTKARLTSVQPDWPDGQSQKDVFTYDPENRRTQEDIYTWDGDNQDWVASSTLKFVYDGSQMVAELDGQNQLLQSYAWGPDGRLMSITDYSGSAPTNYQVVTDGSGNVVELLDSSTGLVAASYQYDPWGNPTSATGPAAGVSPFRWQGEFYDASFGGYYMGAREGSARLHIFLSPDPSGEGSDPNLYRMVGNDPINNTDPTGLRFTTLLNLLNKVGTFANQMSNPIGIGTFMANHVDLSGAGTAMENLALAKMRNPQAFGMGEVIGGTNAAAKAVTGTAAMVAKVKDTGVRILGEAVNASDSEINTAIAADQANESLIGLDQLRQEGAEKAIQIVGSSYGDVQAVQYGAGVGEFEFNVGMLVTAVIDLPATLDTIGEGIVQIASWASRLTDDAEAGAETASLLSDIQNFSAMRNYDYPLPSTDIGSTGFVKTTTPWQRTVIERPGMIDWDFVRPNGVRKAGLTNFEAAQGGLAPGRINPETGAWDPVVLHHLLDDPRGPVMQTWLSDHSAFHQMIARAPNPWRSTNPAWADVWGDEVPGYWRWRTGAYNPPAQSKLWLPGDSR